MSSAPSAEVQEETEAAACLDCAEKQEYQYLSLTSSARGCANLGCTSCPVAFACTCFLAARCNAVH